jgi:hypothetical protein
MTRKYKSAAGRVLESAKIKPDTGYSKKQKKIYQYNDEDKDNMMFFWWKKSLIKEGHWAGLDKKAKAVWPVIASHHKRINEDTCESFPSQQTIAILTGYTLWPVQQAIPILTKFPEINFRIEKQRGNDRYKFSIPNKNGTKSRSFMFHKSIILSGVWNVLSPSAKALYPVMRAFGHFDNENDLFNYADLEDLEIELSYPADYDQIFPIRKYDFCTETVTALCQYAGISAPSFKRAMYDFLERWGLVEQIGQNYWKVFFEPQRAPNIEFLNDKSQERFAQKAKSDIN